MAKRTRLDVAMVERGLEASREWARRLIVAGEVRVNGQAVRAPSTLVAEDAALAIGKMLPYVSRGGLKLAHALNRFGIEVAGRTCLDAGASTGGFTDVLLQRGAQRVYATDVGRGQLAWTLRQDARVVVMEGMNVRYLRLGSGLRAQGSGEANGEVTDEWQETGRSDGGNGGSGGSKEDEEGKRRSDDRARISRAAAGDAPELPEAVSFATCDLAFISLRLVLPALVSVLEPDGEMVALVKPQFEAGQADLKKGIVRDPAVHRRVLREVLATTREEGLHPGGLTASPIRGLAGNVEFLLWARLAKRTAADGAVDFADGAAIEAALAEAPEH